MTLSAPPNQQNIQTQTGIAPVWSVWFTQLWNTVLGQPNLAKSNAQTIMSGSTYLPFDTGTTVFTLPDRFAVGDTFSIVGNGSTGWRVNQGAGQVIRMGNDSTTVGVTGHVDSVNAYASATFYAVSPTTLVIVSGTGVLTFA